MCFEHFGLGYPMYPSGTGQLTFLESKEAYLEAGVILWGGKRVPPGVIAPATPGENIPESQNCHKRKPANVFVGVFIISAFRMMRNIWLADCLWSVAIRRVTPTYGPFIGSAASWPVYTNRRAHCCKSEPKKLTFICWYF